MVKFLARFLAKNFVPIIIVVAIIVIVTTFRFCIIKVGIDQVGVRTVIWGVKRGVVQKDYSPGWHRYIRKAEYWDLFDGTVQTLNLTREARNKEGVMESKEIPIRTADDYDVTVDIIVKYQIAKGQAHKIRQEIGAGERYKQFVENETKDVARNILGKMSEKDLYDPEEKRKRGSEAKKLLSYRLKSRCNVEVIDWLILDMRFDPQLERKIKNIKLAGLEELLNIAKTKAAEERGITQTIDASTEALAQKIQSDKEGTKVTLKADIETKVTEIVATADKFRVEKVAEGNNYKHIRIALGKLLIEKAKAEGERMRREAMTGLGGDLIVALEAARNINLNDIIVSTRDVDLLNIAEMVRKLGGNLDTDIVLRSTGLGEDHRKQSDISTILKLSEELERDIKDAIPKRYDLDKLENEIQDNAEAGGATQGKLPETHGTQGESPQTPSEPRESLTPKSKNPLSQTPGEMDLDSEWKGFTKEYQISQ
ncbi:MAG: SPFH domain-containing protein [Candidatus Scalindua sp.]|nr:SPFH domain-containing protein [Candidatus Scalindua sp.]